MFFNYVIKASYGNDSVALIQWAHESQLQRVAEIETIETSLGFTSNNKPRTMFRPYRYMGATGIRAIVRWAKSKRGKFDIDDGNGSSGCETGYCGL